jgi:hypothetical protein
MGRQRPRPSHPRPRSMNFRWPVPSVLLGAASDARFRKSNSVPHLQRGGRIEWQPSDFGGVPQPSSSIAR